MNESFEAIRPSRESMKGWRPRSPRPATALMRLNEHGLALTFLWTPKFGVGCAVGGLTKTRHGFKQRMPKERAGGSRSGSPASSFRFAMASLCRPRQRTRTKWVTERIASPGGGRNRAAEITGSNQGFEIDARSATSTRRKNGNENVFAVDNRLNGRPLRRGVTASGDACPDTP